MHERRYKLVYDNGLGGHDNSSHMNGKAPLSALSALEAIEFHGFNGYVEQSGLGRLFYSVVPA